MPNRRQKKMIRKLNEKLRLGIELHDIEAMILKDFKDMKVFKQEQNKIKTKAIGEKIRAERDNV